MYLLIQDLKVIFLSLYSSIYHTSLELVIYINISLDQYNTVLGIRVAPRQGLHPARLASGILFHLIIDPFKRLQAAGSLPFHLYRTSGRALRPGTILSQATQPPVPNISTHGF